MKDNKPLVTCVITTYKREPNIFERALLSIIKQSYSNIEIIVVNDYPDDKELVLKLKKIVENYEKERNIQYIVVEKNGGACKARNIAINESNGEYIAFLDDDDEWLANKIQKQVECAEKSNAVLVYCNSITKYLDLKEEKTRFKEIQPTGYIYNKLLYGNIIGSCSFPLIKKEKIIEVGGFNENMPAMQDYELYLRIVKENIVEYIHEPLVIYYSYSGERISRNFEARLTALEIIYEKIKNEIITNKKLEYKFNVSFFNAYVDTKDRKRAIKYLVKIIKYNPFNILFNIKCLIIFFIKPFKRKRRI